MNDDRHVEHESKARTGGGENAQDRFPPSLKAMGLIWISCLTFVALVLALGWRPEQTPPPEAPPEATAEAQPAPNGVRAPVSHDGPLQNGFVYEETLGPPVEVLVKRVDYALLQNMAAQDVDPEKLSLDEVSLYRAEDGPYHHQTLTLSLESDPNVFLASLKGALRTWAEGAELVQQNATDWTIIVLGRPTHKLHVDRPPETRPSPEPAPDPEPLQLPPGTSGVMAIVMDDLGEDVAYAKKLARLSFPVTFSIWPRASNSAEVAAVAHAAGREVFLHQPMEPEGYPEMDPGPGAVLVSMTADEIAAVMDANLASVPHAVGMNNHMGSRFTQHPVHLRAALGRLQDHGMFVLDSLTHSGSKVREVAEELGIPALRRDVFLDVTPEETAILHQLEKAARIAAKHGKAVAICHPFPATLTALMKWQLRAPENVRIVPASELNSETRRLAQAKRSAS